MVQIFDIQDRPSFGDAIGKGFQQGMTNASNQALSYQLQEMIEKKKGPTTALKNIGGKIDSVLRRYDPQKIIPPQDRRKIEDLARNFVGEGLDAEEASLAAYDQYIKDLSEQPQEEPEETGFFSKPKNTFENLLGLPEQTNTLQSFLNILKGAGVGGIKAGRLPFAVSEMLAGPLTELQQQPVSQEKSPESEAARKLPFPGPVREQGNGIKTPLQAYDALTNNLGRPENAVERIAQGIPFGVAGIVGEYASETARSAGAPEWAQTLANASAFILTGHKLASQKQGKAINGIVKRAEKIAEKTGRPVEEVIAKAQVESGANLEKAAQGNATEINKLNGRLRPIEVESSAQQKSAKAVTETPKTVYDQKQAAKERKVFGEKLPETPFEEYLAEEPKPAKRSETVKKEAENLERLRPLEEKKFEEMNFQRDNIRDLQAERRSSSPQDLGKIESNIKFAEKKLASTVEELKDIQYEMKYHRKRPTDAEITKQIETSSKKFIEEAKDPTPEGQKKFERQLDLDKKYLEKADKIIERGEIPGEIRPDTHIKMKQKYLDAYKEIIKNQKESLKEMAKSGSSAQEKAATQRYVQGLESRIKRLKADIINQTEKIKVKSALNKPSGSFYKNQIKGLRSDLEQFKKDYFENIDKPKASKETSKAASTGEKSISKISQDNVKIGEDAVKNPSKENIEKLASEGKESPESMGKILERTRKEAIEAQKTISKEPLPVNQQTKILKNFKKIISAAGFGAGVGVIQSLSEKYLGFKPSATMLKLLTGVHYGTLGVSKIAYDNFNELLESGEIESLSKINDPTKYSNYINSLNKKYSKTKANRIIRKAKEERKNSYS